MNKLKLFWDKIRSNPIFVTVSSAAVGAVVSGIQDEMASGKIDWSRGGINKLTGYALTAAVAAIVHLYRPNPSPTVPAITPPDPAIHDVPATLTPVDPKAQPVPQEKP